LKDVQEKVRKIQGPAARKVAIEIGIGPHVALISGILGGGIDAPSSIRTAIAKYLDVPLMALIEVFRCSFIESEIPAHKSIYEKPQISAQPVLWKEAVRMLQLPAEETERLLKFAD
jgi:hypothetical protein